MVKLILLLALVPLVSFASKSGAGGVGVVCYKNDELVSVELLDIYEAKANGLTLTSNLTGNLKDDVSRISKKVYKNSKETKKVLDIIDRYKSIPLDADLTLTNDAFPIFLRKGCKLRQIATYYNDSLIWIDKNLFDKMDYMNQLALAFHEYIYATERSFDVPDSRYTRTIVGWAFSNQDPFDIIQKTRPEGDRSFLCTSVDKKIIFSAVQLSEVGNIWKFYFIRLNGHQIFSSKTIDFRVNGISAFGDYSTSNIVRSETIDFKTMKSKINDNEFMQVAFTQKEIFLSWVGTDQGDKFENIKVECKK